MNIKEMVEKAYESAYAMQADMDELNERQDENGKMGYAHFGLEYVRFESPYMSREEFIEAIAENTLLLLLKRKEAETQADRYTVK